MCKNGLSGPEYKHLNREQHGKLEVIKPGGTWDSRNQKRNISRRLIIAITVCDHHDTTVMGSKRHNSCLPTQERSMLFMDDLKLYCMERIVVRYTL